MTDTTKKLRGFAALPPERRTELARKGQEALKATGKRYTFNSATAAHAARVGWARRQGSGGSTGA